MYFKRGKNFVFYVINFSYTRTNKGEQTKPLSIHFKVLHKELKGFPVDKLISLLVAN